MDLVRAVQTIAGSQKMIQRKVRTPQGRVLHNVESRQREGKCNRKYTAPLSSGVRVKRCGKSAPVPWVTGEAL